MEERVVIAQHRRLVLDCVLIPVPSSRQGKAKSNKVSKPCGKKRTRPDPAPPGPSPELWLWTPQGAPEHTVPVPIPPPPPPLPQRPPPPLLFLTICHHIISFASLRKMVHGMNNQQSLSDRRNFLRAMLGNLYPNTLPPKLLDSVTLNREGVIEGECCVLISAVDGGYPQGRQLIMHLGLPVERGEVYMILVVLRQEEKNNSWKPGGGDGSEVVTGGMVKPWRV